MKRALWSVILVVWWTCPCGAQFLQTEFRVQGETDTYRARVSSDWIAPSLSQQLDIAMKVPDSRGWAVGDRVELVGLKCPEELKPLSLRAGIGTLPVILVRGGGDTRNFVYIAQVVIASELPDPELKVLLHEYHEGAKPRLQFDKSGDLEALTLQYAAMHELPDSMFPGHIIVARTFRWDPKKRKFAAEPWYVDSGAEKALSLVEAVTFVGSYRLGVSSTWDERTKSEIHQFKPTGILKDKLPENLKSAAMVELVVDTAGAVSIRSVGVTKK